LTTFTVVQAPNLVRQNANSWLPIPLSIVCVQVGPQKLSVIWSSGVSLFRGCLSKWKDSGDFQNCLLYHGCLLLRVVRGGMKPCNFKVDKPGRVV